MLSLQVKIITIGTFLVFCGNKLNAQQISEAPSMEGSWGVRLIIRGGEDLDDYIDNRDYDYLEGARQIVENYPTTGHVITNFTNNANSSLFTLRQNENMDVSQIDATLVPSLENEQVIFEVIDIFKDAGKKVFLYLNHNPEFGKGTADQKANWDAYVDENYDGDNYYAFEVLCEGFAKRFKGLIDGYWIDDFLGTVAQRRSFRDMLLAVDPDLIITTNDGKGYFTGIQVDSDGVDDQDETDYKIIKYEVKDLWSDFTCGHVTPLGQGAPPNSWGYEEFTVTDMVANNIAESPYDDRLVLKHMFAPIRATWSTERTDLVFTEKEQAYRFVKRITDAGASITFSTTNTDALPTPDELEVLKYVNDQLEVNADYVPYVRPEGAYLIGETAPNYHQFIDFHELSNKQVGDEDFFPFAYASSGDPVVLTSSNTNVVTIVDNKIHIVGSGTTNITASQLGNDTFAEAISVIRELIVTAGGSNNENLALNGAASQSTTLNDAEAILAIDGNTQGNFGGGSVTAASGPNAWWQVDIGSDESIGEIKIFNRTDACCIARLSSFTLYVKDSNGEITYSETFTDYPDPYIIANAEGAIGQVIRIEVSDAETLNLAEVEVYAANALSTDSYTTSIENNINIYPNPVQNEFVINMNKFIEVTYVITDITGKSISSGSIKEGLVAIDSSQFSPGFYLVKVFSEEGTYSKKIIKN